MKYNPHLPGTPDEFIAKNMKLAQSIAWKFAKARNSKSDQEDILSIAYLGLIRAYELFDPTRFEGTDGETVKFSTYAMPTIKGYILRYLRENISSLRMGRLHTDLINKVRAVGLTGQEPIDEIAAKAKITLAEAEKVARAIPALNVDSLDRPFNDNGDRENTIGDCISADDDLLDQIILRDFISSLPPRLKRIYELRMVEGRSQSQTGKIMGLTQTHICRMEKKLFKAAREYGSDGYPEQLKRSV